MLHAHPKPTKYVPSWAKCDALDVNDCRLPQLRNAPLRELAHLRWDVENNGFKAANQTVVTKRIYSHNSRAQAAVLLILLTVCNLLLLFYSQEASRLFDYLGVSPTRQLGIELLRTFLMVSAYIEYG